MATGKDGIKGAEEELAADSETKNEWNKSTLRPSFIQTHLNDNNIESTFYLISKAD